MYSTGKLAVLTRILGEIPTKQGLFCAEHRARRPWKKRNPGFPLTFARRYPIITTETPHISTERSEERHDNISHKL